MIKALETVGLKPYIPSGAYYILANVSKIPGRGSYSKAMHLLKKTGVASVPGRAFYHDNGGNNLVRFCFAKDDKELKEACKRLMQIRFI